METRTEPAPPKTILLVEDEDFVRNVTREVLELHGYQVLEAIDADEGLELYGENIDIIDLLLTDVVMPGRNGREFANQLLALRPGLKVIFMSGYTDRAVVRESFSDPNLNYLQKPFTLDTLADKVRHVLEQTPPHTSTCDPMPMPSLAP
ncbi:MAG: response regulator [Terriglobia bacterium]|jgi:DNA-binding NtrC family response regulator|nr:response regulator [Terriglobia bacterium]